MNELLAGLVGAISAFLLMRLSDFLTKIFEREERNYLALIRYSHLLNGYYLINAKNIKIIDNYLEPSEIGKLGITFDIFHEYPIDKETIQKLTNIDLIKEIFLFNSLVLNMNQNLDLISRNNEILSKGVLSGDVDHALYKGATDAIKENLKIRKNELIELFNDVRSLLFTINCLTNKKPMFYKIIHKISNSKLSKKFIDERKREMNKPFKPLEKVLNGAE